MLLLRPDHSAIMNDPDDFGFGDVRPNTLEAEQQHEQEPEQELNDPDNFGFGDSPNTLEADHQQEQEQEPEQESNDLDNFGFGDVSPNSLEAEHQQEQEHNANTQ